METELLNITSLYLSHLSPTQYLEQHLANGKCSINHDIYLMNARGLCLLITPFPFAHPRELMILLSQDTRKTELQKRTFFSTHLFWSRADRELVE